MKNSYAKILFFLKGVITIVFISVLWIYFMNTYKESLIKKEKSHIFNIATQKQGQLTLAINYRLSLLDGLESFVLSEPSVPFLEKHFPIYAAALHSKYSGVRALQIFPKGHQVIVHPHKGNGATLKRTFQDLVDDERPNVRRDIRRTLRVKHSVLSGPYELRQGGLGLVVRKAVWVDGRVFAFVVIVLDLEPLLKEVDLMNSSINYTLSADNSGVFWGEGPIDTNSDKFVIPLPDGEWTLFALPINDWDVLIRHDMVQIRILASLLLFMGITISIIFRNHYSALRKELMSKSRNLINSEERFRDLYDNSSDLFFSLESNWSTIILCNQPFARKLNMSKDDIIGKEISQFISGNCLQNFNVLLAQAVSKGVIRHADFLLELSDKNTTMCSANLDTVVDENNFEYRDVIEVGLRDITEQKEMERELKRYEIQLEDIIAERTKELKIKNSELEKYNQLFVDREFRIKELKDKIRALEQVNKSDNGQYE